jgi:hypothetical protein
MAFRLRTPLGRRLRSRPEDGLSLAEVLIAVFIITPVLIFLLKIFLQNVRGVTESWDETKAISLGQRLIDQIRSEKWDELTVFGSTIATTAATLPLGPEGGETSIASYDDVDDWDGFNPDAATAEFRRTVRVEYVNVDGAGNVTVSAGRSDFKRVTVNVTNRGGRPLVLSVILTNSFP